MTCEACAESSCSPVMTILPMASPVPCVGLNKRESGQEVSLPEPKVCALLGTGPQVPLAMDCLPVPQADAHVGGSGCGGGTEAGRPSRGRPAAPLHALTLGQKAGRPSAPFASFTAAGNWVEVRKNPAC